MPITYSGKSLRAEEKRLKETSHLCSIYTEQMIYADKHINKRKHQIQTTIKKKDTEQKLRPRHPQQAMVKTNALPKRQPGLAQIDASIFIGKSSAFRTAISAKTGVGNVL